MVKNYKKMTGSFLVPLLILNSVACSLQGMKTQVIVTEEDIEIRTMFYLGEGYALGKGCEQDIEKAQSCFKKVVSCGSDKVAIAWSYLWLSKFSSDKGDRENAEEYLKNAAFYGEQGAVDFFDRLVPLMRKYKWFKLSRNEVYFISQDAVKKGLISVVQFLFEVDRLGSDLGNMLHCAAEEGWEAIVELLLSKKCDIAYSDCSGNTALHLASMKGKLEVVKFLLSMGAKINCVGGKSKGTPLHCASLEGKIDVVNFLLLNDASIEAKNRFGDTVLHSAAIGGEINVVSLLLEKGVDIEVKNNLNMTALHYASREGHKDVVELLIDEKADIEARNRDGMTALHFAAKAGKEIIVKVLLTNGADKEAKNATSQNALHYAARFGNKNVLAVLLDEGFVVDAKDENGVTALHLAIDTGHEDVVKFLLKNGACMEVENHCGDTALLVAAKAHQRNVMEILLEEGALLDAKDEKGKKACDYVSDLK